MRHLFAALLVVLAGCTTSGDLHVRSPDVNRSAPVSGGLNTGGFVELRNPGTTGVFTILLLTVGWPALVYGYVVPHVEGLDSVVELPPDPSRSISVQDCTQQIDWSRGNLRCR
jgi:hypothetical protein